MNKHQIVGLTWCDRSTGETIDVYQKSEARGWFNYRRPDGTLGMVKREALIQYYERGTDVSGNRG